MKREQGRRRGRDRQGVALIVVLGFLSIMLLMAVAFLTQARMERMVASSTLEAMRGRQIMRTAVNAAMNDYSRYLWSENLVMPIVTNGEKVFTSDSSGAQSLGGRTIGDDDIELMRGEVEDWIPRNYRTSAVSNIVEDAEWVVVRENPNSGSSRILGRYAYACFDMSGGIDANLAARNEGVSGNDGRAASNRVRRSVRDVPIRLLPEVSEGGDYSTFKSLRKGWKGFDSLYALIHLTDGEPNDGNEGSNARWQPERKEYSPALASNRVSDLTPYSLSVYRGGRYNQGAGTWTEPIRCSDAVWTNVLAPIKSQFPGGVIPAWITTNAIYDYTHGSDVPLGLDYPSPKNVPMFNEIAGTYKLAETPDAANPGFSTYELVLNLTNEFWYPFPSSDNDTTKSFMLPAPTVGGSFATSGDKQLWFRLVLQGTGTEMVELDDTADQTITPINLAVPARYNGGQPYVPSSNFTYRIPIERPPGNTNALPSGMTLRVQGLKVIQPIYLQTADGSYADMLPKELSFPGAALQAASQPKAFAKAATDPRFNHEAGLWTEENGGTGSLNEMNDWFNNAAAKRKFQEEGTNLYCRNGPMKTPAELGFICTGKGEWETIDLCTDDAVEMLSGLVADTNLWATATGGAGNSWQGTSVFYTNGTINPNTRSSNVLMSVFVDLPTHEVPNVDSARIEAVPLNDDTVGGMDVVALITKEILEETEEGTFATTFQAGSDWARIPCMRQGGDLSKMGLNGSSEGLNNNQREALIRNTWGVFSPDNSLFTVVVVGQAIKEGPSGVGIWNTDDDIITGERRAVALVWRDPFKTGQNLHHEMFIRMFRHLND